MGEGEVYGLAKGSAQIALLLIAAEKVDDPVICETDQDRSDKDRNDREMAHGKGKQPYGPAEAHDNSHHKD